jgi:hypothetical protein
VGPGVTALPAAVGETHSFRIASAADPFPVGTGKRDPPGETERLSLAWGIELVHAAATSESEIAAPIMPRADRGTFIVVAVAER